MSTNILSASFEHKFSTLAHAGASQHLLTGEELSPAQLNQLLSKAILLKQERLAGKISSLLHGCHLAMLFEKPSLRTRFSFTCAMRELGGDVIESVENTRKKETPEDQIRVLNSYCHAVMVRTHQDDILQKMVNLAKIPVINGLSNLHHPCQALADLMTLLEIYGSLAGLTLSYVGDGNNVLHSLLLLAPMMGVNVHFSCPVGRGPAQDILIKAQQTARMMGTTVMDFAKPVLAVAGANAVYTDVWTSMGFEDHQQDDLFADYQVNEALMAYAAKEAVFMHCLPMERDKEVSASLADSACSVIFLQSENRLHVQKALLLFLLTGG